MDNPFSYEKHWQIDSNECCCCCCCCCLKRSLISMLCSSAGEIFLCDLLDCYFILSLCRDCSVDDLLFVWWSMMIDSYKSITYMFMTILDGLDISNFIVDNQFVCSIKDDWVFALGFNPSVFFCLHKSLLITGGTWFQERCVIL